jgi:hypothetical protein
MGSSSTTRTLHFAALGIDMPQSRSQPPLEFPFGSRLRAVRELSERALGEDLADSGLSFQSLFNALQFGP